MSIQDSERVMGQLQSIKEGHFLPPQNIKRSKGLQHGLTAYELAIVTKEKAKTKMTRDEWVRTKNNSCNYRLSDFFHLISLLMSYIEA